MAAPLHAADGSAVDQHRSALEAAQRGELDIALARLAQLVRRYPEERPFLHDYISLLQRAGRNDDALALIARIDRPRAPAYVMESLGAAASASGRHALADQLYLDTLQRYPGRIESLQGLSDSLSLRTASQGAVPADAASLLAPLPGADRAEVLHRSANWLEARALHYPALHMTLAALRAQPSHRPAQTARIRLAARLGASHLALQWAQAQPGAADAAQLDTLRRHAVAVDGRWANLLRALPGHRQHGTTLLDTAIARTDALAERFLSGKTTATEAELKWLQDRMVLLGARDRAREVDTLYRAFQQRQLTLPTFVIGAVADARLRLRQPRQAIPLYEQVLREQPDEPNARVGMYFALLEAEEHARAYAWVDQWAAATAPKPGTRAAPDERARHWNARVLQARSREYAGDPARAQAALERLQTEAPANAEVRAGMASVYRARGWPRRAWDTWQIQLLHDPADVEAYAESVGPLLDTYRFEQAQFQLHSAQRRQPEARSVERATRAWQLHHRPELLLRTNSGRSSDANSPSGGKDHRVEATLYSPPVGERYRVFLQGDYLYGDLTQSNARHRRAGAGLEYRGPDLRLHGSWHTGLGGDGGGGARLGAKYWINDIWTIAVEGDSRSMEIPLQARGAGVDAKRAQLGLEARLHESRAFALETAAMDFTDGNTRQTVLLSWREGWLTRPRYWLSSRMDLYGSRNSEEGAPYFNPASDYAASASLTGAWRTYRWYERAFVQELTLSAGRYWQQSFASGPTWGLEYAHVWELDERFYLRYGIGRTLHPYDGQQSGRSYLTLDLDWRF